MKVVKAVADELGIKASELVGVYSQSISAEAGALILMGVFVLMIGLSTSLYMAIKSKDNGDVFGSAATAVLSIVIGGALIANNLSEYIAPETEAIKQILKIYF